MSLYLLSVPIDVLKFIEVSFKNLILQRFDFPQKYEF